MSANGLSTDSEVSDGPTKSNLGSRVREKRPTVEHRPVLAHGSSSSRQLAPVGFDRALTIHEAAQILGISYATVRRLLLENMISYQRVSPRRTVIRESDLLKYLEATTAAATQPEDFSARNANLPDRCHEGCECRRPN